MRAMATMARFPPERILILSYFSRIARSLLISVQEASTRRDLRVFLPMPVMRPMRTLSALEYWDGVKPT